MKLTNLSLALKEYVDFLNRRQLESIGKYGLRSLKALREVDPTVLVNFVTGSQMVQGNICLNHMELEGITEVKLKRAIHIAVFEEYTGVMGISWERGYHSVKTTNALSEREIFERLNSNVLFVVKPPESESVFDVDVHGGTVRRSRCFYNSDDGLSQSRGKSLTSNREVESDRITEIKTEKSFSSDDILFVLVPEALMDIALTSLSHISDRIVPVPSMVMDFRKSPEILEIMLGESMDGKLECAIPNYEMVLINKVFGSGCRNFCLHAVRLTTSFDLEPRFVSDLASSREILIRAGAMECHRYNDGSGVVFVHKTKLIDYEAINSRVGSYASSFGTRESIELRKRLIESKGESVTKRSADENLRKYAAGFMSMGIKAVDFGMYILLFVPTSIGRSFDIAKEAKDLSNVVAIQSVYRGCIARRSFNREITIRRAAKSIQRVARGHIVRTRLRDFREAQEREQEVKSRVEELRLELERALALEEELARVSHLAKQRLMPK